VNDLIIKEVFAYEVLDSRGNPTLATEITLSDESSSLSYLPSGASTGKYEALEKRDLDENRYSGKGVLKAVNTVNKEISQLLIGLNPLDQKNIDLVLCQADGTEDKSNFGANSILGASLAILKVSSKSQKLPLYQYLNLKSKEFFDEDIEPKLPIPMMNILNGGVHADNPLDFQEFMIQPASFQDFKSAIQCGVEIFHQLKEILKKEKLNTSIGDEGGFAPQLNSPEEALDLIIRATEQSGYKHFNSWFVTRLFSSSYY
jgi:enolase